MAKLIKFPLEMANGAKVRTLEDLKEHYDVASVIKYYKDGRLQRWLKANYQDEIAENLQESEKQSLRNIFSVLELPEPSDEDLKNVDLRNISDTENSTATENENLKAEIGYIAYSDGSVSEEYDRTKIPVGIVIEVPQGRFTKIVSLDETCSDWRDVLEWCNNYADAVSRNWRLPTREELYQLYEVKNAVNAAIDKITAGGGNATNIDCDEHYWSSSESIRSQVWCLKFYSGVEYTDYSFVDRHARAVRYFTILTI